MDHGILACMDAFILFERESDEHLMVEGPYIRSSARKQFDESGFTVL